MYDQESYPGVCGHYNGQIHPSPWPSQAHVLFNPGVPITCLW